ncbi:ATP-binding protein [Malacoplasma penetrans]|uniref:ATP-binding protein n=1 Tax=Malacoplasma penetrans TaxID=28227 RepID=UPI001E65AAD5|nr:AAA family ATPase [Malacoplasma penetrans]
MEIKRNIIKVMDEILTQFPILLITGARQVGKTTIAEYYRDQHNYNFISLDNEEILEKAKTNPQQLLKDYPYPLIIDEVQRAPNLFMEITHIVNEIRRTKGSKSARGMFILTGSQKYHLIKNVTESMAGRVAILEVPPLSQSEINNQIENPFIYDSSKLENFVDRVNNYNLDEEKIYESIFKGFYPELWNENNITPNRFYSQYIKSYLERDVSEFINVKDKRKFLDFLVLLSNQTANDFIPENLSKHLQIDRKTVESWVSILVAGDLVTLLNPYNNSLVNIVKRRKRIYFNDVGLLCHLLKITNPKSLQTNKHKGKIIETYIFNEIKKSYLNSDERVDFYYYRDGNKNEIDLIVHNISKGFINLIECKSNKNYSLSDVKSFKLIKNEDHPITGKLIICFTDEIYRLNGEVLVLPVTAI